MYKVKIKNELTGRELIKDNCANYQAAQDWANYQVSKPNSLAGRSARWIKTSDLTPELTLRVLDTRVSNVVESVYNEETEEYEDTVVNSYEESQVKNDYVIEYEDITEQNQIKSVQKIVKEAMTFGQQLMVEFSTENIMMGITQDGMTKTVRKNMSQVMSALMSGSLYDAIDEAKSIPSQSKDSKYLTDARLLQYVNKIEEYLGIELSNSL